MNIDLILNLDLLVHQLSQSLLLELSIVKENMHDNYHSQTTWLSFVDILNYAHSKTSKSQAKIAYRHWLTSRGFGTSDLLQNWKYLRTVNSADFFSLLTSKYTNDLSSHILLNILEFLNEQLNDFLTSVLFSQSNSTILSRKQVDNIEQAFVMFDSDGKGYLDGEKTLLLFSALLAIGVETIEERDVSSYSISFNIFRQRIGVYEGKLSARCFKQFFIQQQIMTDAILNEVQFHFESQVTFQRASLLDKSLFLALSFNSDQNTKWLDFIKQARHSELHKIQPKSPKKRKSVSSNIRKQRCEFLDNFQKESRFSDEEFKRSLVCDKLTRILYQFLTENFESLKYHYEMENSFELYDFVKTLIDIFKNNFSAENWILILIDRLSVIFLVFTDVYMTLFDNIVTLFHHLYLQKNNIFPSDSTSQFKINVLLPDLRLQQSQTYNFIDPLPSQQSPLLISSPPKKQQPISIQNANKSPYKSIKSPQQQNHNNSSPNQYKYSFNSRNETSHSSNKEDDKLFIPVNKNTHFFTTLSINDKQNFSQSQGNQEFSLRSVTFTPQPQTQENYPKINRSFTPKQPIFNSLYKM